MSDYPPFVSRRFGDEYENVFGRDDDKDDGKNGGRGRGGSRNGNNKNPNCDGRGSGDGKGDGKDKDKRGKSNCRGFETMAESKQGPDASGSAVGNPIPGPTSTSANDTLPSGAAGKQSSHQLVIVLAVLSTIIGLLIIALSIWLLRRKLSRLGSRRRVSWNPFYRWKYGASRRPPSPSRNSRDVEDADYYPYSLKYDHLSSPSTRSSWGDEKKFRAISVGGNTSHTLTTSNTNLVVAAPPMPPLAHLRRSSRGLERPSGFYDPSTHPVAATEPPPDHLLVAGGVRNAELLLSRNNSANSTLPGS